MVSCFFIILVILQYNNDAILSPISSPVTRTRLASGLPRGKSWFSSWKLRGIYHIRLAPTPHHYNQKNKVRRDVSYLNKAFVADFIKLGTCCCRLFALHNEIRSAFLSHTDWYVIRLPSPSFPLSGNVIRYEAWTIRLQIKYSAY